jgi:FixJ family two-component response regulator
MLPRCARPGWNYSSSVFTYGNSEFDGDVAEGNANKEIADQLWISEVTVKGRVRNILSRLGANDRTHAAMIGLKRGIIEF